MNLLSRFTAPPLLFFACALLCHAQPAATQPRQDARPPSPAALTLGEWREFAPAGGGFSILFPGTPESSTRTERLTDRLSAELHIHNLKHPTLVCGVVYADYPVRVGDPAATRAFLDSAAKGAVADGGQLLSFTEIEHQGHPGRMLRRRMPDGNFFRAKIVLVGARSYQAGCETPREDSAPAEIIRQHEEAAAKFIDSFKLAAARPASATGPSGPIGPPPGVPDDEVGVMLDAAPPGEVDQYLADHADEIYGRRREGEIERLSASGAPISTSRVAEGKSVSKPTPAYPAVAKAARARGPVVVRVVVDEEGKVVAAQAYSGHPLLRASAVKAAREARFTPTLVDGMPVKVAGVITYNFDLR